MPAPLPGDQSGQLIGTPPNPANPPNAMNSPTPGTSAALANAAAAQTGSPQ